MGAQRTAYWAENLHKYGYYPIVITRQWNESQTTLTEKVVNNEMVVEKCDGYEVHRLPYKESLRDRLDQKGEFKFLQKALTLKEIVLSNFSIAALPYSNFYAYAKSLLQSDSEIGIVIASGRPFQSFAIGHQLKKDFPKIHWVPDYRDEWSTTQQGNLSFLQRMDVTLEHKVLSNATIGITVSRYIAEKLKEKFRLDFSVVMNGIAKFDERQNGISSNFSDELHVLYAGTLYAEQNVEILIQACKAYSGKVKLKFVGIEINSAEKNRVIAFSDKHKVDVVIESRKSPEMIQVDYKNADLLFITGFSNIKGYLPVKMFSNFQTGKAILLCPSDNNVMEEFIQKTNSGYIANTVEECKQILQELLEKKKRGESIALERNMEVAYFYSREYQTKKLAEILDSL
ncbi:hypothetical protein [Lishizhenia sp.]|uniref:hypothetical protein n=1 Tax=Lishizhenia sp. TaxID=2497594 RepID=UPI00299E54C9|nr:hypothetical protein [Lishizhenia sp.]MDX1447040.1 hypothetical protein [Lishizhenia sp.]